MGTLRVTSDLCLTTENTLDWEPWFRGAGMKRNCGIIQPTMITFYRPLENVGRLQQRKVSRG